MAWTQTDLDAVEAAIGQPEATISFSDGSSITYRSTSELLKTRDAIKSALNGASGAVRCTFAKFTKD
jgi:hypothetical protein